MAVLAFVETPFLSITAIVADAILKTADIKLLGFEPTGSKTIMIRVAAREAGDLEAALKSASREATRLGVGDRF